MSKKPNQTEEQRWEEAAKAMIPFEEAIKPLDNAMQLERAPLDFVFHDILDKLREELCDHQDPTQRTSRELAELQDAVFDARILYATVDVVAKIQLAIDTGWTGDELQMLIVDDSFHLAVSEICSVAIPGYKELGDGANGYALLLHAVEDIADKMLTFHDQQVAAFRAACKPHRDYSEKWSSLLQGPGEVEPGGRPANPAGRPQESRSAGDG